MRSFGVIVDDCASCHLGPTTKNGGQCLTIANTTYGMHFDGWKCYFRCKKPTARDLTSYPIVELTSDLPYLPQRRYSRRAPCDISPDVVTWRARLGYPTFECTKATMLHCTSFVKTLQAETREYMRDHYKTRVFATRPRRINDVCYSDTFFSSLRSIRGYKCFQLFAFKLSKFDKVILMKREACAPTAYEDLIRSIGAPNKTVTDNASVLTGVTWTNINRKYCIETGLTVPHHQHQNYSEGVGGNFKFAVLKLLHNTPHAPLSYWCYAANFLDKTRRFLSQPKLGGKSGFEMIKGETGDISIFRFSWFEPIWFYNPSVSFPKDKIQPGFFLDIAENTGDGFSYEILPVLLIKDIPIRRNPVTLVRSVVRQRNLVTSDDAPRCVKSLTGFKFFNRNGDELFGTEEVDTTPLLQIAIFLRDPPPSNVQLHPLFMNPHKVPCQWIETFVTQTPPPNIYALER